MTPALITRFLDRTHDLMRAFAWNVLELHHRLFEPSFSPWTLPDTLDGAAPEAHTRSMKDPTSRAPREGSHPHSGC